MACAIWNWQAHGSKTEDRRADDTGLGSSQLADSSIPLVPILRYELVMVPLVPASGIEHHQRIAEEITGRSHADVELGSRIAAGDLQQSLLHVPGV